MHPTTAPPPIKPAAPPDYLGDLNAEIARLKPRKEAARPTAADLRVALAEWVVTARHLVHRLRLEAEDLLGERNVTGSPLADLLDQSDLGEAFESLSEADAKLAGLVAPGPPVPLPSPAAVLFQTQKK